MPHLSASSQQLAAQSVIWAENSLLTEWFTYGREQLPYEACGALFGRRAADGWLLTGWRGINNAAVNPEEQFTLDPLQWVPLVMKQSVCMPGDEQLLGVFHTHPAAAPIPSAADLQTTWHALPCHAIISFCSPGKPLAAFYRYTRASGDISLQFEPYTLKLL
ncbi:Mov34/MPN/PAD-1 family protein [Paenibacillus sp. y28]|uniref:Mov34/MPN/PAD-1 family protein n=1 Tax=Paenibacillus sp. y28 TaxID=3129110 RepID=UPI0030164A5C